MLGPWELIEKRFSYTANCAYDVAVDTGDVHTINMGLVEDVLSQM